MPYTRSHVISSLSCPFHGEAQSFSFLRISFTRHLFGMAGPTASGGGSSSQLCAKALVPQSPAPVSSGPCLGLASHNKLAGFPTKMNYRYYRFAVADAVSVTWCTIITQGVTLNVIAQPKITYSFLQRCNMAADYTTELITYYRQAHETNSNQCSNMADSNSN